MIIIKLNGGIGNQMFQYAFGRRMSIESKAGLKLDITGFNDDKVYQRKFSLACFNINENYATERDLKRAQLFKSKSFIGKLIRVLSKIKKYNKRYILNEKTLFVFDSNVIRKYKSVYIEDNWQNEKYFTKIEDLIRKDFSFKEPLKGTVLNIADRIQCSNSVAIHLRKYDDIPNQSIHTLTLNYYFEAIKYLTERFNNLHFYIFSDNPEWAKENLLLSYDATFVEQNKDYEDLRLMSLCKHQIIANSSYSWWAAWLNNNPHKIIISPQKWFGNSIYDTSDLIPEKWIRI